MAKLTCCMCPWRSGGFSEGRPSQSQRKWCSLFPPSGPRHAPAPCTRRTLPAVGLWLGGLFSGHGAKQAANDTYRNRIFRLHALPWPVRRV